MDQAFGPGISEYDSRLRETIRLRRPDGVKVSTTNLLSSSGTLENFLTQLLVLQLSVPRPVPEILLLSHASDRGWLQMALTDQVRNEDQFEALLKMKSELNIPEAVLTDGSGVIHLATVRICGCRIGLAPRFLQELKRALKNVDKLIAPKHLHSAREWYDKKNETIAFIESLGYRFESYPKRSATDKKKTTPILDIIKALTADKHKLIDGTVVPDDQWQKWLNQAAPRQKKKTIERDKPYTEKFTVRMPSSWNVRVDEGDLVEALVFKHCIREESGPWSIGEGPDKGTAEERRDFVKSALTDPATKHEFPLFFDDHPWSIWLRYLKIRDESFSSLDEFMNGLDWIHKGGGSWSGMRHVYCLDVPITQPVDTNILLCNYYPVAEVPAHVALEEIDGPLFKVV